MCWPRCAPPAGAGASTVRWTPLQGDSHPQTFIPQLLDYQRRGEFPFERLIRHYPFAAINDAVADMQAGRCIKPVLLFDTPAPP